MNKLLPTIEELKPITDSNNTFYDCGFNSSFDSLSEQKKLQIICDIVRETILPTPFPNPEKELINLEGNCSTACLVAKSYLEELKLCKNIKHVMARKRVFDPDDIVSIHSILLIEGNDNNLYQFDPTPFVGYKFGKVESIDNPIYYEYVEITDDMQEFLNIFKEIIYLDSINKIDKNKVKYYIDKCIDSLDYKILGAYCGNALKKLIKYIEDPSIKNKIEKLILELRPYSKVNKKNKEYQIELLNNQVSLWNEELNDLKESGKDIKRQLELSQNIIQELKMVYPEYEIMKNIKGNDIRLSFINPRFMYENGLNTIMIKTSAYYLNCNDYIEDYYKSRYKSYGEYSVNLANPTELTGIKPMLFSHPLGETCIRSLDGESKVLLLEGNPDIINKQKRTLREEMCHDMWNKEYIWFDDKPIIWDPFVTNIVHGTDNATEAALHYLIGYPEHQNMTRFMYPNPKLKYKEYK